MATTTRSLDSKLRDDAPVVGLVEMVLEVGKVDPVDPVVAHSEPDEQEDRQRHVRRPVARRGEDLLQAVLGEGVVDALVAAGPHLEGTAGGSSFSPEVSLAT